VAYVTIFFNVGAVVGAILFGMLSERIGRRYSMLTALVVALAVIPAWAFGSTLTVLAVGAFLMQMGVQGAWGIIPVHLNELSPDSVRGLLPGFTYQVGILFASFTPTLEFALRNRLGYAWALTAFELVVIAALALMLVLGSERRGRSFIQSESKAAYVTD
jgi:SHS family lactate transporter-like MFS transporter